MEQKEPSVLDFIKSKLNPRSGIRIEIPAPDAAPVEVPDFISEPPIAPAQTESDSPRLDTVTNTVPAPQTPAAPPKPLPLRSLLALIFALAAQRSFEPPRENPVQVAWMGAGLLVVALAFLFWAWFRHEWILAPLPETTLKADPLTYRRTELILATIFLLGAFFLFTNNLFTQLNVSLWVIGILLFVRAFWISDPSVEPFWKRAWRFITSRGWNVRITWWTLAVVAVLVISIFFRFYRLDTVLAEPFSDHAEKLLDVGDILDGQTHIFFPRNTGREFDQMYLSAFIATVLGTGLSFMTLKIGTVLCGLLTLPYVYLLGREVANKRVGLLAMLFTGMAYWPNLISRIGLRFPLYPLFTAPALYYLIRGLRTSNRNDFILAGLFIGLGLNGYSTYRFVPFVILIAFALYMLHGQSKGQRKQTVWWLVLTGLSALLIFLPLLHFILESPDNRAIVFYRSLTRLTSAETQITDPIWQIFLQNFWKSITMLQWSNGDIWVHSVMGRPALDVVSGALFLLGAVLMSVRYLRTRHWVDLFILLSIPLLMMPSILSLAFPSENPSLNRTGGAYIPAFLLVALALDGLLAGLSAALSRRMGAFLAASTFIILFFLSSAQNFDLVFNQFDKQFRTGTWNTSDMGRIIAQFDTSIGDEANAFVVPFPYWVDTRLVGVQAGFPRRDFALWRDQIQTTTASITDAKLFIVKPEDEETVTLLRQLFPSGALSTFTSDMPGHDFLIYYVPPIGQ